MNRAALLLVTLAGCAAAPPPSAAPDPHHAGHADMHHAGHADMHHAGHADMHHAAAGADASPGVDAELREVARIHGAAGPWAVAGYRMGRYALAKLGLERQSFDLEVIHHSPRQVQFSCIADGAAAATGASVGKLNLAIEEADPAHVATTYRRKSTGASISLRPTAAFAARFKDVPDAHIPAAGKAVMELPDEAIFEAVPSGP